MATLTLHGRAFDVDAAIFDLDGTLVDTLADFGEALNLMLAELALPAIAPAEVALRVGKGSEYLVLSSLKHVLTQANKELTAIELEALDARAAVIYQRHYGAVNGRYAKAYPGVRDGLSTLAAAQLPMVCVTNKPTAFAKDLLRQLDLLPFFGHVFGGDAFSKKKPDPMPLLRSCEALGTAVGRTLMVGDSANDAQAARGAGCPVALVTYGYNHGQPARDVDADAWTDSLADLRVSA